IGRELGAALLVARMESLARRARVDLPMEAEGDSEAVAAPPEPTRLSSLTPPEREGLGLLADGRTNQQFAERLSISEKPAGVHVPNIINKLGVTNRGEAAAVAHRLGLAG